MKTVISVAIALALTLSVVPAMAGETFQALSNMSTGEQELLMLLSDEQLAAIEGTNPCNVFAGSCVNLKVARIKQSNVCAVCANTAQANVGVISQSH